MHVTDRNSRARDNVHLAGDEQGLAGRCPDRRDPAGLAQAARPGRRLAKAEPKTLRRLLHAAARLTRGGRQPRLKIQVTWSWAADIVTAWDRVSALPQAP
jgi:hypothetical protein